MNRTRVSREIKAKGGRFLIVGTSLTLFDYLVYELIVMLFFRGNTESATIASVISGTIATIVAYFAHSRITWKTRNVGKPEIVKFFVWNAITMWAIRPILTLLMGKLDSVFATMGVNELIRSTGIFAVTTGVIMILNYLVYDRFVFGGKHKHSKGESANLWSVTGAGKGKCAKHSANPKRRKA